MSGYAIQKYNSYWNDVRKWAIAILVSIGVMFLGCAEKEESTPTPTSVTKLVIENVSARYDSEGSLLDKASIDVDITIKNVGNGSFGSDFESQKIILEAVVKGVKNSVEEFVRIKPNETWSSCLSFSIERCPREYEYKGIVYLKDESGKILDKENFSASIPTARIGDTVLIYMRDGRKFDLTLNSWHIEPNEWDENEVDIVINVTIKNSYSRTEEDVPTLNGVVMTEKGYVLGYRTSHFYCPTQNNPYRPCPSSLLPEESFTGELRIEGVPKDWKPVELSIFCLYGDVKEIIILGD